VTGQSNAAVQMEEFPNLLAWKQRIGARDAVKRALERGKEVTSGVALNQSGKEADAARKILFGQRAR
jgi:hypothetical protein